MGAVISSAKKQKMLPFLKTNFGKMSEREMAERLRIGKTAVNRWCRELGFIVPKHTVNENFFKTWTPEMAYILGYIFADGNINWDIEKSYRALTITAAEKDAKHLENIRVMIGSTKPLLYSKNTKSYRLIVNNSTICKDLMRLGVTPKKSLTVKFPNVPKPFLNHLVRGVIDGDGNVRYVNRKRSPYFEITISSGSEKFLTSLSTQLTKLGIAAKVWRNKNGVYILQYSCSKGIKLANWIYDGSMLHLQRKYEQYKIAPQKEVV
jgi:hypothetical protein